MKVVAFNGSPRKGGNTEQMIKRALAKIEEAGIETELIQLGGQNIHGCLGCAQCLKNRDQQCVIKTDKVNEYIQKMIEADGIILGSPTYFSGMTAEMKALIDRAGYATYLDKSLSRKIGAAIGVHRRGGGVNVTDAINHFFLINRMIIPGSTYWNFGVGLEKGDVQEDTEGLANMDDLGETMAWLIKSLKDK